ncbi:MAG: MarR family transcriptional regulator [Flavobacteriales bacterium]|nr:MarR family transcriptional regulator [Flavobacteriales bacterium]
MSARIEEELLSRFESEQQKAMLNILFTANWFKAIQSQALDPFDISMQQYNILRILRGAKGAPVNMNNVKSRMIDRAPNATRLTDKLISKGLVERERSIDDRRVVHLMITEKGKELIIAIDKRLRPALKEALARLNDQESMTLNMLLDKFRS